MSQLTERPRTMQSPDALAPVLRLSGASGVLTVYVDADPALGAGPRPAWQAPVRAGLRRLVRDAYRRRSREERLALEARLAELDPELRALLDPRRAARGRALFASLDGGPPVTFEVQAPLPSFVALGSHAFVLPLLAVLQDGARAGVAAISSDGVEHAECELGLLQRRATTTLARRDTQRQGRATNVAVPQSFPERDRFRAAADTRVLAQLREEGARLAAEADARGWDAVVTDGDPRLVDALADGFDQGNSGAAELVPSPRPLVRLSSPDAAEVVAAAVRAHRADRHGALVRQLDESAAATRDPFVLERALDEGRVEHVLLAAPAERRPAYRAEALARRAFATGAGVTVLDAAVHDLGPAGVAALLRW